MKKILILDDDEDLTSLIKYMLEKAGYTAVVARNPVDGIRFAREYVPDLMLVDVMLPGMNGAEVVRGLKADAALQDIPILFLTGLLSREDSQDPVQGVNVDNKLYAALAKPFETDVLLKEIKRILG